MNKDIDVKLKDRAKHQIYMLTVIFLAGMAVNVLGMPSENTGTAMVVSSALTLLHVLIGIGLIVEGGLLLRLAYKRRMYVGLTWGGMASVLVAFVSGILMMALENDWLSYSMAVGFVAAFLAYGAIVAGRAAS